MASSFQFSLLFFFLLSLSPALAKASFHPHALLLPVQKDPSTLLYITQLNQRTPLVSRNLALDLGGQFLWVDCEKGYSSTTYRAARCGSAKCSLAGAETCVECFSASRPGCSKNTCELFPENTVISAATNGDLGSDVVSIQSTDGVNPGRVVSVHHFLFVCAPTFLLKGLPSGVRGMAGLGRTKISLPSKFSSHFRIKKIFAICLSASASASGVVFFGPGPYHFLPFGQDVSTGLIYTPLLLNPISTATAYSKPSASSDYFIGVTSIQINQITVPNINASLLTIDHEGNGGTKISTVTPYTVLQTSIYIVVLNFFQNQLSGVPTVAAVAPFGLCFNSTSIIPSTRVGPAVPPIDLVLQNATVFWRIFGANSMVQVSEEVLCLGFVDGGMHPKTSIVIGGYQIEDNLLQFDLGASWLGFSSSLLFRETTCSNFNFTSNA